MRPRRRSETDPVVPPHVPARVLMTTDAVGGVWQYSLELSAGLLRRGVRVLLAAMGPAPSPAQMQTADAIGGLALVHRPYRLEWMAAAERDLERTAAWLAALASEFDPDIVHVNGYVHAGLPWRAPVVLVCHSCVRSWWAAVRGGDVPAEWDAYSRGVVDGLIGADVVVAPTQAFLDTVQRTYQTRLPSTAVIFNARSGPFRIGFAKEPFVFSCGRAWDEAKGFDILDCLAARLPWPVFVAGSTRPADGAECRALAYSHALGPLRQDELSSWLARASLFVLPARYEPFGLAILEAAKSGCALVLGEIDTLRELWDGAAVFVNPRDEGALRKAVMRLIGNPLVRLELGARALYRAKRYSVATMIDSYLRAYRRALVRHRSGPTRIGRLEQLSGTPVVPS